MTCRLGAVLFLAGAAYAVALPGPFQFDDFAMVATDPGARTVGAWWADAGSHVRPLTKLTFALSHSLGTAMGHVPAGHRIVNVAIHLLAIAAFFVLGRQLAGTLDPSLGRHQANGAALAAAAFFGLHPLATEAVSYLSGRSMALATLLAAASLLAYIRWRVHGRPGMLFAALAAFGAAALAREVAVVTPLAWLAWEWLRPPPACLKPPSPARAAIAGAFLLATAFALWLLAHPRYVELLKVSLGIASAHPGAPSLTLAFHHFFTSMALLRYPNIDPSLPFSSLESGWRLLVTAVLCGAAWTAWRLRHDLPCTTFGIAWTAIWLVPVYALPIRLDTLAERHFYPAIWGFTFAVCITLARFPRGSRLHRAGSTATGLAILFTLAAVTTARNTNYLSEIALWESALRSTPGNVRALNNLGVAYMDAGRWDDARRVLAEAQARDPGEANVLDNLLAAEQRERGAAVWLRGSVNDQRHEPPPARPGIE